MIYVLTLWLLFAFFSFGVLSLNYVYMRKAARQPWKPKTDGSYMPKVSIVVPTYNEEEVIGFKLRNLAKLEYPKNLVQMIFVDSHSTDSTASVIQEFAKNHPEMNATIIVENERRGKASALNNVLSICEGEVLAVSDADCFWPSDILSESLPYLADPAVGAVSGPKLLLNAGSSRTTKSEEAYLDSMNLMKLGESKKTSTVFFEGGFSAYKRAALESFDPYETGSDDCGTVIRMLEKGLKAIMVSEARFFTTFPETWKGKMEIKMRRASQLIRVFWKYAALLFRNRIRTGKQAVLRNLLVYLVAPFSFLLFAITTLFLVLVYPLAILLLAVFLIPKVNRYVAEVTLSYLILLSAMVSTVSKRKFVVWKKPQDRTLFSEEMLSRRGLI
jgi:cellulose synthase/poly-beta-1,6-N-acetylglucosamine synthase-like glycosyltransferase